MMIHIYKVYRAAAGTLLLTAALAACTDSREPMQENETPREGIFFSVTATQGEGAETRVTHEHNTTTQGIDVKWASEDKIYVGKTAGVYGYINQRLSPLTIATSGIGQTTAQFDGTVADNHLPADRETLYALYGKADKIQIDYGDIRYSYDGQRQTENGNMKHLAEYDFMIASTPYDQSASSHHFSFSHVGSMMKFTLDGLENQTVQQLTLEAYDRSYVFLHESDFSKSITLDLGAVGGNGISIGSGQQLEAYLMLGETTKTAGQSLILHVTTADNKHYAARLTGANIDAGKIYTVYATLTEYSSGTFQGEGTEINPYQINSAGDLTKLMLMTHKGWIATQEKHFKLTRDIDMKGEEGFPIGTDRYWFEGTFSGAKEGGGNYSISNLQGKMVGDCSGLFGALWGATIKNVTVRGKIIVNGYKLWVGGIAGVAENSTIENCISDCEISNTSTDTYVSAPTGGILGYSQRNNKVINCQNLGSVSSNDRSGGIIGYALDGGEITGCTNSGEITSTSTKYPAGGIIGRWDMNSSNSIATLTGCTLNNGSVPAPNTAGSIIGSYEIYKSASNSSITITNSGGSGSITSNADQTVTGKWPAADIN